MQLRGEIEGHAHSPSNQAFLLVQNQHAIDHAIMALMQGCDDLYEVLIHPSRTGNVLLQCCWSSG